MDTYKSLIADYQNGIGTTALADKYGLHRSTVQSILLRNNIKLRKTSPRNTYNIRFFSTYTPESCYWAGFILADGYLRSNRNLVSIKLMASDSNHLEKFKECIDYSGDIHFSITKHAYCYIDICGEWFINDLVSNFDITPRKSKTTTLSSKIPIELYPHFIRGIVDGDGSITHYKTKNNTNITLSICGTYDLLLKITEYFRDVKNIKMRTETRLPKIVNHPGMFTVQYGMHNTEKILSILYTDTNKLLYLERKFQKWIDLRKSNG